MVTLLFVVLFAVSAVATYVTANRLEDVAPTVDPRSRAPWN
jgi:hypothetical protein